MKIVQIVTQMEAGGAQKVASLLTEGLRQQGHDTHLWFLYKKSANYEESEHVRVLCPSRPVRTGFAELGLRLLLDLRAMDPDAVITHTHSANSFAAPIAAAAGVPLRVAVHHNPVETYSRTMRILDRCAFTAGCYSQMIAVSGGVKHSFSSYPTSYQKKVHRIYNSIVQDEEVLDIDVRQKYKIPSGAKLLVNVGRLSKQKNQILLLQLLKDLPHAFLLLIGEGELRQQLIAEADRLGVSSQACFTGALPPPEVNTILRQSDIFLLSSTFESFCLAAVEAMHCGLPVIASKLPCLEEVLGSGQIFFPVNNLKELTNQVKYVLNHLGKREAMSFAGQAQSANYSVERMVACYENLLAEAMQYARPRKSAANDLRRFNTLGGVTSVHDHL